MSTVSPLDLNYKEDSPRADTKTQSLLLPKGSNVDTVMEEKTCCKKIWMDQEHRKSSSCTCSSTRYVLQQKQCHLSRSHRGEDNHSSHPKKASDTASTSSPQKQKGWLRGEEQRRRPERKQVFVLLANTLLAPSRMNRLLSIRRSSTLHRRTPLGTHDYNRENEYPSATDPA